MLGPTSAPWGFHFPASFPSRDTLGLLPLVPQSHVCPLGPNALLGHSIPPGCWQLTQSEDPEPAL